MPEAFERQTRGGETAGAREAIDRMVKQQTDAGTPRDQARRNAIAAAERRDRRNG